MGGIIYYSITVEEGGGKVGEMGEIIYYRITVEEGGGKVWV